MPETRTKPDQFQLRFPDGMRAELKEAAKENGRSLNSEILARLAGLDTVGLRDRFAGQAPATAEWFEFAGQPMRPQFDINEYGAEVESESRAEALAAYHAELDRWRLTREAAWRYSFADAMLAAREARS